MEIGSSFLFFFHCCCNEDLVVVYVFTNEIPHPPRKSDFLRYSSGEAYITAFKILVRKKTMHLRAASCFLKEYKALMELAVLRFVSDILIAFTSLKCYCHGHRHRSDSLALRYSGAWQT